MKYLASIFIALYSISTLAAQPTCHTHSAGNYCSYHGKVKQIYINSNSRILLYFETPIDVEMANSFGMNISNGTAATYMVDDNPEFAKLFYSTALAAQATNRTVSIQMWGSSGGYLSFDRIWLNAPQ